MIVIRIEMYEIEFEATMLVQYQHSVHILYNRERRVLYGEHRRPENLVMAERQT
jgi:hypothetical protein